MYRAEQRRERVREMESLWAKACMFTLNGQCTFLLNFRAYTIFIKCFRISAYFPCKRKMKKKILKQSTLKSLVACIQHALMCAYFRRMEWHGMACSTQANIPQYMYIDIQPGLYGSVARLLCAHIFYVYVWIGACQANKIDFTFSTENESIFGQMRRHTPENCVNVFVYHIGFETQSK